MDINFFDWQ